MISPGKPTFRAADLGWLLPPCILGVLLRLWNVSAQILAGDEMHAVRVALSKPLPFILTHYELRDNCIPLTALYRFLLERGVALSELTVRLPMLLASFLALLLLPWIVARRLDWRIGQLYAWLLALSPLLVLYSRIARPYLPIVLFGFLATAAFEAWWRTGQRSLAAAYVASATLAVWFHLGSAPFVLSPFLFALGSVAIERRWKRSGGLPGLAGLAVLGGTTAASFLLFLLPARASLLALVENKHEALELSWKTLTGILTLEAGAIHAPVVVLFWLVALYGLFRLLQTETRLGLYTLTLAAGQVAGLLILSPELLEHPLVFGRYLLPVLPWVLLWVAVGLAIPWWQGQERRGVLGQGVACAALVLVLFLAGPLAEPAFMASSFTGHNDFVGFFCSRASLPQDAIPSFYKIVRQQPGATVLEYPWFPLWSYNRVFYLYQEFHHRDVLVAAVDPLHGAEKLAFRNMPFTSPEAFLTSRARYLIIHVDVLDEEAQVTGHCWPIITEMKPFHRHVLRKSGAMMAEVLSTLWGKADYQEDGLVVWDLARLRHGVRNGGAMGKV